MSSVINEYTFMKANNLSVSQEYIQSKQWNYQVETGFANGGTITLDLSQLANSQDWVGLSETVLGVPLVLTMNQNVATPTTTSILRSDMCASLKWSNTNLVHSYTLENSSNSISNNCQDVNVINTFEQHVSCSSDDLKSKSHLGLLGIDDSSSWSYNDQGISTIEFLSKQIIGNGLCNNFAGPIYTLTSSEKTTGISNISYENIGDYINDGLTARLTKTKKLKKDKSLMSLNNKQRENCDYVFFHILE
jgi:hypothetical protein